MGKSSRCFPPEVFAAVASRRTLLIESVDRFHSEAELFPNVNKDFNNNPSALSSESGWRAEFQPSDHPLVDFHFDVVIGADGRKSTLDGEIESQRRVGEGVTFSGRCHSIGEKCSRTFVGTRTFSVTSGHIYFSQWEVSLVDLV